LVAMVFQQPADGWRTVDVAVAPRQRAAARVPAERLGHLRVRRHRDSRGRLRGWLRAATYVLRQAPGPRWRFTTRSSTRIGRARAGRRRVSPRRRSGSPVHHP
jgi:uncharacterized protein (DUF2336 family)